MPQTGVGNSDVCLICFSDVRMSLDLLFGFAFFSGYYPIPDYQLIMKDFLDAEISIKYSKVMFHNEDISSSIQEINIIKQLHDQVSNTSSSKKTWDEIYIIII